MTGIVLLALAAYWVAFKIALPQTRLEEVPAWAPKILLDALRLTSPFCAGVRRSHLGKLGHALPHPDRPRREYPGAPLTRYQREALARMITSAAQFLMSVIFVAASRAAGAQPWVFALFGAYALFSAWRYDRARSRFIGDESP